MNFDKSKYSNRIMELTAKAKEGNDYTRDCDIGEAAYLETLLLYIKEWQNGQANEKRHADKKAERA